MQSLTASGGDERDRTDDPLLAKQVLSQLSYTPISDLSSSASNLTPNMYRTSKIKQRLHASPSNLTLDVDRALLRSQSP